jgi:hypothetical protein
MARIRDLMGTGNSAGAAQAIAGTAGTIAASGTTQATAKMCSFETNNVTSGAGADSVVLPTGAQGSQPGDSCYVIAVSATTVQVFPGGADTINGSASAVNVAQNKMAILKRYTSSTWGLIVTA